MRRNSFLLMRDSDRTESVCVPNDTPQLALMLACCVGPHRQNDTYLNQRRVRFSSNDVHYLRRVLQSGKMFWKSRHSLVVGWRFASVSSQLTFGHLESDSKLAQFAHSPPRAVLKLFNAVVQLFSARKVLISQITSHPRAKTTGKLSLFDKTY